MSEVPASIVCGGVEMIGVLHAPTLAPRVGVVLVVGGPQYRVGSHRQFLLLGRELASHGVAVLRFDCRGMGDSDGDFPGFDRIQPDIAAAVEFMRHKFSSIQHVALWGLCDATSAICDHAQRDARISGVVLLNPWVRTEEGHARSKLKHYYLGRLAQREFLLKVLRGEFELLASARELLANIGRAIGMLAASPNQQASSDPGASLAEKMGENLMRFRGSILLIVSGRDLTAKEFTDAAGRSKVWRSIWSDRRLTRYELAEADHTFSRRIWRDQVANWTWEWIKAFQ
jgi:exosortase A-associated hydrolase 1